MLFPYIDRYRDEGLLILRLGFGLGFAWFHGLPKLMGGMTRMSGTGRAMESLGIAAAPEWFGLAAALAETVGGVFLAVGFLFRPAALVIGFVMLVATVNHYSTGQGTPAHSFKNTFVLLGLVLIGPGRYSVDHVIAERRQLRKANAPLPPRDRVAAG
jgi:putative oxidoreductase